MGRLLLVVMVAAACSDSSSGGPIKVDDLRAAYVAFACNSLTRCGLVESSSECRTLRVTASGNYSGLFTDGQIEAAKAGILPYDGTAAGDCLASFFSTCDRNYLGTTRARVEACDHIFTASAGSGAACGINEECVSGYCETTTPCVGTCYGSMAPPPRPHLGESCQMNTDCIDSWCDTSTSLYTCQAFGASGTPCQSDNQCQSGLSCRTGTCRALAATGGACSSDSDCSSIGDYCNGTCTKYGVAGDACSSGTQCAPLFYRCDSATQKCVSGPRLGDVCTGAGACIDQSYCDTTQDKCVALLADGAQCMSSDQCKSGTCDQTTFPYTCMTAQICY